MEPVSSAAGAAAQSLLSLLTEGGSRHAALAVLHQRALHASGGLASLLFELHPVHGDLVATSGAGVDVLPADAWIPQEAERAMVTRIFADRVPVPVADLGDRMPSLFAVLGTTAAILLPLVTDTRRFGMLAIGLESGTHVDTRPLQASDVPGGFLLALDVWRLRQREAFEREIRELLDEFALQLSSTLDLSRALEPLCVGAARLFAADRTTVWLHDRESRTLQPMASSDLSYVAHTDAVRTDDPLASPAAALRMQRAGLATNGSAATSLVTVPLRGCRRALGTVVFEGVRLEPGDDISLLMRADELGRQLSNAIETIQLLDVVHRSRVTASRGGPPEGATTHPREQVRSGLIQSEKLAALGQFVAGVAHELNNPLQSVLGHLELLRATGAFPETIREEIRRIYRDADRAAKIVRNLMAFAGSGQLRPQRASLNGIVQKVLALRKASCRARQIEVVRHYDLQLPRIQVDALLLHQVFLNIVMNAEQAVEATGRPGRIEVVTGPGRDEGWVLASVKDSGAGISDDTLPRVFEPFYTTRDVGQGIGLGLALAYGIVQEHGGRIEAANHPDGGAVFTVELPIAQPA